MSQQTIQSNNFIDFVFKNEPKPIKSINLEFETDNLKELFENLLDIFKKRVNILNILNILLYLHHLDSH